MLRAEQLALIQEANQQLLAIRQQEMEYYTNTFTSFGTQGSLIAGFTLGALTGLDMRDFDQGLGLSFWKGFFHILAAMAMGASVHCILTTTFANIYGPNLALRGPSGSMVRAVKGMIAEKAGIFLSFIMCLIGFQFITLAATWVKMQTYAAVISSMVLSVGALYWYKYCLRIYNRFKFIEPDIEWRNSDADSDMGRATEMISRSTDNNENIGDSSRLQSFQIDSTMVDKQSSMRNQEAVSNSLRHDDSSNNSVKKKWFQREDSSTSSQQQKKSGVDPNDSDVESRTGGGGNNGGRRDASGRHFAEGYLSKMGKAGMMSKGEWNRRYFVLRGSDMFYYKSREDFEMDPSKSIKNRPIGIAGYGVRRLSEKDKPPFEFELKPLSEDDDRRTWHFRCDILDEMITWLEAFNVAVQM